MSEENNKPKIVIDHVNDLNSDDLMKMVDDYKLMYNNNVSIVIICRLGHDFNKYYYRVIVSINGDAINRGDSAVDIANYIISDRFKNKSEKADGDDHFADKLFTVDRERSLISRFIIKLFGEQKIAKFVNKMSEEIPIVRWRYIFMSVVLTILMISTYINFIDKYFISN